MSAKDAQWFFYILRCRDNSLYSGITNNLDERIKKHNEGTGAKYTSSHKPVTLVYCERYDSASGAKKREHEVKGWPKTRKEALVLRLAEGAVPMSGPVTRATSPARRPRYLMPDFILKSLEERGLVALYKSRPPYQQNDYIGWITRDKRVETRLKRLNQMLDELRAGTSYMGMDYRAKVPD